MDQSGLSMGLGKNVYGLMYVRVGLLNLLSPDVFSGVKMAKNALATTAPRNVTGSLQYSPYSWTKEERKGKRRGGDEGRGNRKRLKGWEIGRGKRGGKGKGWRGGDENGRCVLPASVDLPVSAKHFQTANIRTSQG